MRIVGGRWRGRSLEAPEGRDVTRPTTDRMRESMASMVLSAFGLDLGGVRALDAFAGSGALGLEMLSRGAQSCTFVDRDRRACARVRRNAATLGASPEEARVLVGDVFRLARRGSLPGAPFSLVLLDPPYAVAAAQVAALVGGLSAGGALAPGAKVLYERDASHEALELPGARAIAERTHGITTVQLLETGA